MVYNGTIFYKESKLLLTTRNPFLKDVTCIDYDQDSDDEWHELHFENLEDDALLVEEEGSCNTEMKD